MMNGNPTPSRRRKSHQLSNLRNIGHLSSKLLSINHLPSPSSLSIETHILGQNILYQNQKMAIHQYQKMAITIHHRSNSSSGHRSNSSSGVHLQQKTFDQRSRSSSSGVHHQL